MHIAEWLANVPVWYVIIASVVLFVARMIMVRYKTPSMKSATEFVESALIAIVLVFLIIRPFVIQAFFIPSESMVPTLTIGDRLLVNKFIYRFREPSYGDVIVFKSPPMAADTETGYNPAEWTTPIGKVTASVGNTGEVKARIKPYYRARLDQTPLLYVLGKDGYGDLRSVLTSSRSGEDTVIKLAGVDDTSAAAELEGAELYTSEKDYIKRLIGRPGDVIEVKDGAVYRNGERLDEPYLNEDYIGYDMEPTAVPEGMVWVMGDNRNNSKDSHVWGALDRNRILGKAMVRFWPPGKIGLIR